MREEVPTFDLRTHQERLDVDAALAAKNPELWTGLPNYGNFDRGIAHQRVDDLCEVILANTNADPRRVESAYDASASYIDFAYDNIEGRPTHVQELQPNRAFFVPFRLRRPDPSMRFTKAAEVTSSDSRPFYPLLDPEFGIDAENRLRTVAEFPASVIETATKSPYTHENGVIAFVPLFEQMKDDLAHDPMTLWKVGAKVIDTAARLAHHNLGVNYIGLGATIPILTNFGRAIKEIDGMDKLVTTTGHGGTVHMIVETVNKLLHETPVGDAYDGKIGVIGGAGSIGWSSTVTAMEMLATPPEIHTYDKKVDQLHQTVSGYEHKDKVHVEQSVIDVLQRTSVIISATTTPVDLDKLDPHEALDLTGKVIIDDSQPACFDREQVEARGGNVVWVVGEDGSDTQLATRDGMLTQGVPYNFGDLHGLYGPKASFGCDLEVSAIAAMGRHDLAIDAKVTPENVRDIGRVFRQLGFRAAQLQAYSQPVHF